MLSKRAIAFGAPLLVVTGVVAQVMNGFKVTGDMVSASYNQSGPSSWASVNFSPADTADARAYAVDWQSCTYHPDPVHSLCVFAGGLAPRSSIKPQQVDSIGVDVDISKLSVIIFVGGWDCTTGTCVPFTPPSVPLKGYFTLLRGPGSRLEQSNGSSRTEDISPFGGFTFLSSFSGNRTTYSANFAGTVGMLTVTPPPVGYNATLTVMKGQRTSQVVYPPM